MVRWLSFGICDTRVCLCNVHLRRMDGESGTSDPLGWVITSAISHGARAQKKNVTNALRCHMNIGICSTYHITAAVHCTECICPPNPLPPTGPHKNQHLVSSFIIAARCRRNAYGCKHHVSSRFRFRFIQFL